MIFAVLLPTSALILKSGHTIWPCARHMLASTRCAHQMRNLYFYPFHR